MRPKLDAGTALPIRTEDGATLPSTASRPTEAALGSPPHDVITVVPSVRPTWQPDFDCSELAMPSLAFDSHANLPLDVAVPVRVDGKDLDGLDHATLFVLLHVDGVSPIRAIAETAQLPVSEVIGHFLELLARGAVELGSRPPTVAPPPFSGFFRRRAGD